MLTAFSFAFGLSVLFSVINYKWLKLPHTIGLLLLTFVIVIILYVIQPLFPALFNSVCGFIYAANFEKLLFNGLLSFLLFAGALNVNINELEKQKWSVFLFSTLGVLISTIVVGILLKLATIVVNVDFPLIYCFLFGALISPTDPIAVISILKKSKNVANDVLLKIEGESLFNDGIGVVVFSGVLLFVPMSGKMIEANEIISEIGILFVEEAIGGLLFGALLGLLGNLLIKLVVDNPHLAVVISLAIVITGYSAAGMFHVSGPLAMVVAGLLMGNSNNMKNKVIAKNINEFWEILDEVFNGVLFVLMGLAFHLIKFDSIYFIVGVLAILIVLLARYISLRFTYKLIKDKSDDNPEKTVKIMTWGGLRGGISLALALSLGNYLFGDQIILITYVVVIFSIVVQGLTIGKFVNFLNKK